MNNTRVAHLNPESYHRQTHGDDYEFMLSLDDEDAAHSHDDVGHGFPCTRDQLAALGAEIKVALAGMAPLFKDDDDEEG